MSPGIPVLKGVSMICTLYNESDSVLEFLDSVFSMEAFPEEFIIVDGGSTDGTADLIAAFLDSHKTRMTVRLRIDPECNRRHTPGPVARGRNVAIGMASGDIIAVTDAGCRLDRGWIEKIVAPLRADDRYDVAGGWYLPDARTRFEKCVGDVWLTPPGAVNPKNFLPSSRSVAFRKTSWKLVGGYPEHTLTAEDTSFVLSLRNSGATFTFVPAAIVYWRVKSTVRSFARLVYMYGYGDGSNVIMMGNVAKVVVKLSIATVLLMLTVFVDPAFALLMAAYLVVLVARHRWRSLLTVEMLGRLPCAIAMKFVADVSYLAGYLRGRSAAIAPPSPGGPS